MKLQNPGTDAPKQLAFTEIPHLAEFFLHGGVPGVEYLYLLPEEMPRAQAEGWSTIVRMPFFSIHGVPFTAMARGNPITGAAPGSVICRCHMSIEGQKRVEAATPAVEPSGASTTAADTETADPDATLVAAIARQREKVNAGRPAS